MATAWPLIADPKFKELEEKAAGIVQDTKKFDEEKYYKPDKKQVGGQYLDNKATIAKTKLYDFAWNAPKGAHLHIHFNACLAPNVLLDIAAEKAVEQNMYISTDIKGALTAAKLGAARIQFHYLVKTTRNSDLFESGYQGRSNPTQAVTEYQQMLFRDFLAKFGHKIKKDTPQLGLPDHLRVADSKTLAMNWLQHKLVFSAPEVKYPQGTSATCNRQWGIFDGRTQMMKGLFNYEHAYRRYTRLLLQELYDENIMYAEIRPNFMNSNQVFKTSNPAEKMDNFGIMDIIIKEVENFKDALKKLKDVPGKPPKKPFHGLGVIYCTPRVSKSTTKEPNLTSLVPNHFEKSAEECLQMRKKYGKVIVGIDIIGQESPDDAGRPIRSNPLKYFEKAIENFQAACAKAGEDIPFLPHAGETHGDPDGNLAVAMRRNAKRIAHGFCLPKNKTVQDWVKSKNVCVECCPISNEILGLGPSIKDAAVYKLMKEGVHCALGSDNPTLFSSNLSYDFYQVMIGDPTFTLQKWKKLMQDSLLHSIWPTPEARKAACNDWQVRYKTFVNYIIANAPPQSAASPPTNGTAARTNTGLSAGNPPASGTAPRTNTARATGNPPAGGTAPRTSTGTATGPAKTQALPTRPATPSTGQAPRPQTPANSQPKVGQAGNNNATAKATPAVAKKATPAPTKTVTRAAQ